MATAKKLTICLLLLSVSTSLAAQTVIKGMVKDAETGEPLPGTNVYLANTTIGASTNADGHYKIEFNLPGVYNLVFSFIGYQTKIVPLKITSSSTIILNAELKSRTIQLEKLSVTASNEIRKKRLAKFKEEFIGTTPFAEETSLLNPEALRFDMSEKGLLLARAVKPLKIINRALGYKIYIELKQFKWSLNRPRGLYIIYTRYKPMNSNIEEQRESWKENRRKTYKGSFLHFLRSLYYDKVTANDFSISRKWNLTTLSDAKTYFRLLGKLSMKELETLKLKGFRILGPVLVEYDNFPDKTLSYIGANTTDRIFIINKLGGLLNPGALRATGYWNRLRVANSLPHNYRLKE